MRFKDSESVGIGNPFKVTNEKERGNRQNLEKFSRWGQIPLMTYFL